MADISNLSQFLEDVANAIREKREVDYKIKPENFDIEILSITSGSGGDTSDATATADDVLSPKTFYAGNKKQVGTIDVEYGSSNTDILRTKIKPIKSAICDYRDDLGYYLVVNTANNTVEVYNIKHNELVKTLNTNSSLTTNNITSALTIRNAKFSKAPVQDTVYNICVSAGNYGNGLGYDVIGLGVVRFDTKAPDAELDQFSYYHQDGSNYNTANRLHGSGLVESNNYVYSTIHSSSSYWQSNKGSTRLYYIDNDDNKILLKYSYNPGEEYGHIPYMTDDCRFVCLMNSNVCRVLKYNDARTNATVLASYGISSTTHRCIVTNNGVIYNRQYVKNEGTVHTYDTLPFGYNDTVIYDNGYLVQFVSGTNKVTLYKLDSVTYEITAYKSISFDDSYTISYVGENGFVNITNYPLFNCDGISVYTPSISYLLKNTSESNTILSANIKGTLLQNTDLVTITADKVLEGNIFVNNTGSHTGTMPDNGPLNYEPSISEQQIPSGYTSGGKVNPVTASIDENILPENIKQGVTILGVEGEITPGAGDATSDANLQAKYLLEGYSMVEDGILIAGTMKNYGTKIMEYTSEEQEIPTGYYDLLTVPVALAPNLNGYSECLDALIEVMDGPKTEHIPLTYIKSTGTQYIDTGIKCKSSLRAQFKFSAQKFSGSSFFGAKGTPENDTFRFFATSTTVRWYLDYGSGEGGNRIMGGSPVLNTIYEFEIGNRYVKDLVTNTNIISGSTVASFSKAYNFLISGVEEELTIYYCKLFDGDTLIADFIPADDGKGNIGMYDKVSKQFFNNAGTGSFVAGEEIPIYEELNYIESTGTQYVNTNIKENDCYELEFGFIPTTMGSEYQSYLGGTLDNFTIGAGRSNIKESYLRHRTVQIYMSTNLVTTDINIIKLANNECIVNGMSYEMSTSSSVGTGENYIMIFNNAALSRCSNEKLYYLKLYDNTKSLVRDFIPVKRTEDSKIGLYDKVTKTFYMNDDSGEFISGGVKE